MKSRLLILLLTFYINATPTKTIEYKSLDGLLITADLYGDVSNNAPMIILFHQAGWSRGEYKEIAPKLVKLGFNCIAFDQRSGNEVNGVRNRTKERAEKAGKPTTYLDALQDMEATFIYVMDTLKVKKIIVWGSSYSAALTFVLTSKHQNEIMGMLAFSPGEYFEKAGKRDDYIQGYASEINIPVFIASAKDEHKSWEAIYDALPSKKRSFFLPQTPGQHGSRALWGKFPEHNEYWKAVTKFLNNLK